MNTNSLHRSLLGCLLLLALPSVLLADDRDQPGWAVEIKAIDSDTSGIVNAFSLEDEQTGTALGIAYGFNRYVSVEAGYADHGRHFATDCPAPLVCLVTNEDEIDVKTLSVAVVATWPITKVVELYGKFGVAAWDADFARFPRDDSDREFLYGVGIGAWVAPNFRLSLQYDKVDSFELETLGIGLAYRF